MTAATEATDDRMGTRWGRATLPLIVGLGALGAMTSMVMNSVLALNLTFQNSNMDFATSQLSARNVGIGVVPAKSQNGSTKPVLRAGFATATMDGICLSKSESILGYTVNLRLTAGDNDLGGTQEITAANATFDLTSLSSGGQTGSAGNGIFLSGTDQIGQASTDIVTTNSGGSFNANPLDAPTQYTGQGWTGIGASAGTMYNIRGSLVNAQVEGSLNLPGLNLSVTTGTYNSCQTGAFPK